MLLLVVATGVLTLPGCGRCYALPGHDRSKLQHPPDVTMHIGERRKAVTTGFAIKDLGAVIMESSDPQLVAVEPTDNARAVYLRARKPIVRYTFDTYAEDLGRGAANDGFEVRVVPAR